MATPNAPQTLGLMIDMFRDRLLERIEEVQELIEKSEKARSFVDKETGKTIVRKRPFYKNLRKEIDPTTGVTVYKQLGLWGKELKESKRALGALLTTDPNFELPNGQSWLDLTKDVMSKNIKGNELANKIKNWMNWVDTSNASKRGGQFRNLVGHHRTGLSILRQVLEDKPFDYRTKFKEIAKKNGFLIGEEFVDFIDPIAHKEFTKLVNTELGKRLGVKTKVQLDKVAPGLYQQISDRYAHATQFGGRSGFSVPKGWLKSDVDADTLFKFSEPYLEAAKRGADQGLELTDLFKSNTWETAEDLKRELNKISTIQTDDLFDIRGNPFVNELRPEQLKQTLDPEQLLKRGLKKEHFQPHLFQESVEAIGDTATKKGNKILRNLTAGTTVTALTSLPSRAFGAAVNYADVFIPDKDVADKLKQEDKTEGLKAYYDQLKVDVPVAGIMGIATKGLATKVLTGTTVAATAPAWAVPLAVAGGVYSIKRLDDNLFDGSIQKGLKESRYSYLNPFLGEENVKQGIKNYEKDARRWADKGGLDVSGYNF
jgi:hypothetical protein